MLARHEVLLTELSPKPNRFPCWGFNVVVTISNSRSFIHGCYFLEKFSLTEIGSLAFSFQRPQASKWLWRGKKVLKLFRKQSLAVRMISECLTVVQHTREEERPGNHCQLDAPFPLCPKWFILLPPLVLSKMSTLWLNTRETFWLSFKTLSLYPPFLHIGNNSKRLLNFQPKTILIFTALLEKGYLHGEIRTPKFSTPA